MLIHNNRQRLNQRGIALPLALLGLVAITLMVTTALVSGATESAISGAQQSASKRLYLADGGLEAYLLSRVQLVASGADLRPLRPRRDSLNINGNVVNVNVSRLRRTQVRIPAVVNGAGLITSPETFQRTETFSLIATPKVGGRSVGAMYSTLTSWSTANLNINSAGAVAASVLRIPGNSGAMSGVDQSGCTDINDGASGGTNALSISDSVRLELDTARVLESVSGAAKVVNTGLTRAEFALQILGGMTPEDLARGADIRWGDSLPGPGGTRIAGLPIQNGKIEPAPSNARPSALNWGCANTQEKLEGRQSGITCNAVADTGYYPVIAVDAPEGSAFKIQGSGQGFLIVFGDADLRDLNFFGVVIVTGDVQLNGTGYIGGAFVALGDATLGREFQQGDPDEVDWMGQTFVRFNRCGLNAAQAALAGGGERAAAQSFANRSLSWFEVVR